MYFTPTSPGVYLPRVHVIQPSRVQTTQTFRLLLVKRYGRPAQGRTFFRNPLDVNGDGVIDRKDFIPSFLDRDGDGHISIKDIKRTTREPR